jgi:hypothetical protein
MLRWYEFPFDQSADFRLITHLRSLGHDVSAVSRNYPHSLADEDVLDRMIRSECRRELPGEDRLPHLPSHRDHNLPLEAGGTLVNARAMAAHESPRTTKLHDRTADVITLDEVERIVL